MWNVLKNIYWESNPHQYIQTVDRTQKAGTCQLNSVFPTPWKEKRLDHQQNHQLSAPNFKEEQQNYPKNSRLPHPTYKQSSTLTKDEHDNPKSHELSSSPTWKTSRETLKLSNFPDILTNDADLVEKKSLKRGETPKTINNIRRVRSKNNNIRSSKIRWKGTLIKIWRPSKSHGQTRQ